MSATDVLQRVLRALDASGVPYMVTGSFASSAYGEARASKDIDIVIAPTEEQVRQLAHQFTPDAYYISEEDAVEALAARGMFNVIDFASGWKIDFIIRKNRPFSEAEFSRRTPGDVAGVRLFIAAAEDILLAKLEWAMLGGSERQIDDAAGILRYRGAQLDYGYIERWVRELGIDDQWSAAQARASK